MKTVKEFLNEGVLSSKMSNGNVKGWIISNVDFKQTLITYEKKNGKVMVTFSDAGWHAADPKKNFDTIDQYKGKYEIQNVLNKL